MSVAFTTRTTIDRPAAKVWESLVDWDSAQHWMSDIEWLKADGPTQVGTRLTFRARGKDRPSTIADLDPGEAILLRSEQGGVTADYHYRLHPIDESTTDVELTATCATRGAWSLVGPLLRAAMRRADRSQLDSFKRHIETSTP